MAGSGAETAVRLHQLVFRDAANCQEKLVSGLEAGAAEQADDPSLTFLQPVDVLRVHAQQQAFVMQHADEVVDVVGPVAAGIQSLRQGEEWQRVIGEVIDVEDGLRVGDVELLQVSIQACSWSSGQQRNNTKVTGVLKSKKKKKSPQQPT